MLVANDYKFDPGEHLLRTIAMHKEKLFYDGACPLCNTEVSQLKKLADNNLQLINVHDMDVAACDVEPLLRVLHYQKADGVMLKGLDANVAAWQHTPLAFFWKWLRWPFIRRITDCIYLAWADLRFKRLYPNGINKQQDDLL